ncbi:abortive infection system antitoxin AbiGi family protein [Sporosarcina cyprini]|uniref:abortive infection system antitoxin AbiGi family protein n=1 Tax=Sporosarcina cyprini TaxID=2910523 RepID=UPI001EDFCD46|nr:abortive infection system antitoxin AbiGi family protein [Sporosarcina cyprini]MCG3086383.1 abortive infection system antitoxin AbiGi family protein [Sporosarcina cyprini]
MNSENKTIIEIGSPLQDRDPYIKSQQSANVLFNFMRQLDYLKMIIKNQAIIPRYYEETIEHLEIEELKKISFPMTCFCDINLQKLIPHVEFYGFYGIGLDKKWGIDQGLQPIRYINKNSKLKSDFLYVFSKSLDRIYEETNQLEEYNNYLLTDLLFTKPLNGEMYLYRDKRYIIRNFHDEMEWRYVPDMSKQDDLPLVIPQNHLNPKASSTYSEGLRKRSQFWLKFDYEFIKYLIVKDENDRDNLIRFISQELEINGMSKGILISKIMVFNNIREDW